MAVRQDVVPSSTASTEATTTSGVTSSTTTSPPTTVGRTTTTGTAPGGPVSAVPIPSAGDSPAEVARRLVEAETAIADPATPFADLQAHGRAQQAAYTALAKLPAWRAPTLAQVPPALRPVVEANLQATVEIRSLTPPPKPQLPPWRILTPEPPASLMAYYGEAERLFGVPWEYLAAIHFVESRMGRIRGPSTAGAQGPMQFLPSTWRQYGGGGDINSNRDAILAAGRYLRASGAPTNMARALYAYNPSQHYVRGITGYAERMRADQQAYLGYYHWQVYYGDRLMPEGYGA